MSSDKDDSKSNDDDDEEIIFKRFEKFERDRYSSDDSTESFEEDFEESDGDESFIERDDRRIGDFEDDEVSFDYDDRSSTIDDLEHLDYEEEDEIMQVIVDEHGQTNVAIIDDYEDDDDVIMEEQSLKTEAEVGSEIFESSPNVLALEDDVNSDNPKSLKSTLKAVTQQFVKATLLLGTMCKNSNNKFPTLMLIFQVKIMMIHRICKVRKKLCQGKSLHQLPVYTLIGN